MARMHAGALDGLHPNQVCWIVADRQDVRAYATELRRLGGKFRRVRVIRGGSLCASRNRALHETRARSAKACVQISDDVRGFTLLRYPMHRPLTLSEANAAARRRGAQTKGLKAGRSAKLLWRLMRRSRASLGAPYPTSNPGTALLSRSAIGTHHFCIGDFMVIDAQTPCRFDTRLRLKEDYDYTCTHIQHHGRVCRWNGLLLHAAHRSNYGGAVDVRTRALEKKTVAYLRRKWPHTFWPSPREKDTEVVLRWRHKPYK